MPDFNIDMNGILKLLANLKPDKATSPDGIKPVVLKDLREEIAPVIQLLFKRSLTTGKIQAADLKKAYVSPVFNFKKSSKK